jgi:hypothetical protein
MKFQRLLMATSLVVLLAFRWQTTAQDSSLTSAKKLYESTGNEAVVMGTISVKGKIPAALRIDMSADPVCAKLNPKSETDWIITNGDKLQNVFIYVKQGGPLETYRFPVPDSEAILQHQNCQYVPHVLGVRVMQSLLVQNSDPTAHNSHPQPKNNPEWNQTQPSAAPPLEKAFSRAEMFIPFKDNQHPWEKAYVGVFDHPFFAVSNEFGSYKVEGLPPGTYTFVVWHEKLGEQEFEVTLVPGESRNLDFTFDADKETKP